MARRRPVRDTALMAAILERITGLRRQQKKRFRQPATTNPAFKAASGTIKRHGRTRLGRRRLATLWRAAMNAADVPGSLAEVGTYQGGSAYFIAATFRAMLGLELPFEVIDTFTGHPPEKRSARDLGQQNEPGMFTDTSFEDVVAYLSTFELITVHRGEFSRVAPTLPDQAYRFVHLDVDLYESTVDCLRYFAARLSPGGVIVVDDYGKPSCPGIEAAIMEFLAERSGFQLWEFEKQAALVNLGHGARPSQLSAKRA